MKTFLFLSLMFLLGMQCAGAQTAVGDAAPNPFADPHRMLDALPTASPVPVSMRVAAPIAPPLLPMQSPAVLARQERQFEQMEVLYIAEALALLRTTSLQGETHSYLVQHNMPAHVAGKWVMPEVRDGVVSLYDELSPVELKAMTKARSKDKGTLFWQGAIETMNAEASMAGVQNAQGPAFVGPPLTSPSQKVIGR
jgi:hypothetical protein